MLKSTKRQIKGSIILLTAALFWGSSFVAQKISSLYPFQTNCFRFILGSIVLLPVLLVYNTLQKNNGKSKEEKRLENKKSLIGGILCGLSLAFATAFQQLGMSFGTTAGKSGFLTALYMVLIPIASLFLGKKYSWLTWACVAIAFIGAFLMSFTSPSGFCLGDVLTVICALCFTVNVISVDHFSNGANVISFSILQCLTAGIINGLFLGGAIIFDFEALSLASLKHIALPVVYISVFSCAVAYTCQVIGQKYTQPAPASIIMSLESVFSLIFGMLVLKEKISLLSALGIILMLGACILSQLLPITSKKEKT